MVKSDPKRDYYADLEVPQNADTEDIRKQFRKLAFKYHPDRNPGREEDVVSKFQAIQAAHEILGDTELRAKYDNERRKYQGYYVPSYRRPPPPPRNAHSTTATSFPPPPQRATRPPPRPQYNSTASTAPNGASRFTNFPKPPPNAQRPNMRDDAEARANVFNAWQRMGHRSKTPPNGEETFMDGARWNNPPNASKPGMGRSNTTRTPRKAGFDPKTPGADEPQAHGTAYYNTSRYRAAPPDPPPPQAQNTVPPSPKRADPLRHFKTQMEADPEVPFTEGRPRIRTPYPSTSGEKTMFSSAGLGRSASTRNSPSRPNSSENGGFNSDSGHTRSRYRSASPNLRKPFSGQSPARDSASTAHARPKTGGNATRPFTTYDFSSDESDEGFTSRRRRTGKQTPPTAQNHHYYKSPQAEAGVNPPNGAPRPGTGQGQKPLNMYDDSFKSFNPSSHSTEWSDHWPFGSVKVEDRVPQVSNWAMPSSVMPRAKNPTKTNNYIFSDKPFKFSLKTSALKQGSANARTRFNIPTTEENSKANFSSFKSRSAESINTKFSPNDWSGKFEGTPDYFTPVPPAGRTTKGRQSPTRGRPASRPRTSTQQSPQIPPPPSPAFPPPQQSSQVPPPPQQSSQMPPPPPPQSVNTQTETGAASQPAIFSPSEWQQTFKESSWVYPAKGPSPTRPASVLSKRTKAPITRRPSAAPKQASVSDAADEPGLSNGKYQASAENLSSDSQDSSAMDIDTDVPSAPNGQPRGPAPAREARTVPASPQKAEWKEGSQKQSARAPSSTTDAFGPGLDSLIGLNVAPIAPSSDGGLRDLRDLTSTLPFESRASANHPFKPSAPQNLGLPPVPKAPDEPARVTKQSFADYMQVMYAYMALWHKFNSAMVLHFAEREKWCECLDPTWLTATGEITDKPGFDSYLRALQEDEKVRKHWNIACEKHQAALEACAKVREKVLRGVPDA